MPEPPPYLDLAPAWARGMYVALATQIAVAEENIMAKVTVEESDLAAIQTQLGTIADDLQQELEQLNIPAGDLTGVQAVVQRLRTEVTVPAPDPGPPVPEPTPTPDPGPAP